ncbi:bcl-2 homologous antagonist/killer-like [Pristis pectinata]|uniref:bcl-2 homologous antagonist/killer-like n=1 Tax=Pristis pectinata TaxID=685728 RepID=UPI00223CAC3E|nr:bcl-2 homologous antagonist/killer-like [Pristis pectinata]XP_051886262.1 bcl-2 homologous antagonist/killer-like [Pristis pectinata]XP_051886263.1 bcl-2 homologous antagonist/killer-like [Pristis pectinata]
MASGKNGDSCRSCSSHEKKTNEIDTEQNKVEEADDIFQNNVHCQYQNEVEEDLNNGVTMPGTPTVADLTSSPVEIGHQLAIIGDELNHQKNREFQAAQVRLPFTFERGYESFCRVAERLFDNEINWHQTITLLSFGYKSMRYVFREGIMESFGRVTEPIAKIVAKNQITQWIAEQGGWTTALSIENVILKWLFGIFVVAMLGVAIVCKIYKP